MAAVGKLVTSVNSAKTSRKNAKRAEQIGELKSQNEARYTEEKIRNLDKQKGRYLGEVDFGAARAGVDVESKSVMALAAEGIDEIEREKAFTRATGLANQEIIRTEASATSSSLKSQAFSTLVGGVFDSISIASGTGGWWSTGG